MKPRLLPKAVCDLAAIIMISVMMQPGFAQQESGQPAMQEAQNYFFNNDFDNAVSAFEKIVESEPQNGSAWLFLGAALHNQEKFQEAIIAFERAESLGTGQARVRFNLARSYARLGKTDDGFAWLEKATQVGFGQVQALQTQDDLKALREDARFAAIVQQADQNARPCEYNPDCRAFDFWIGEWEVFMPNGQKAGENVIEKTTNGCLLLENWTSANGGTGRSMNYYDAAAKKWQQLWVDGTGGVMSYEGVFSEGAMRFEGYQMQANGEKSLFKMTFTPQENGDVRQYIEQSVDGGKTFQVWFDGMYKQKRDEGDD